jgi:DNA polymerase elongation subunit (family B)
MIVEGWLFDVYPHRDGVVVWVLDAAGRPQRLLHRYQPVMYIAGPRRAIEAAGKAVATLGVPVGLRPTQQRDLMTGEEVPVVRVAVGSPVAYPAAAQRLARVEHLTLYNCDIPVGRLFFYETGLFPLAHCHIEHTGGVIRAVQVQGGSEDLEYDLPPLTTLRLRLIPTFNGDTSASPAHGRRGLIEIGVDGEVVVVDGDDPAECLYSLNRMLARYGPDVILTEWGDAFLLPQLRALAARAGLPLHLNRDIGDAARTRRSRSYVTYGQVVYQAGAQMLRGRWHIDLRNSFIYSESEMAGLLEIARLARIPVQDLARTSTGTAISSMQLNQAVHDGVLIPWRKSEPEGFKTAAQLIVTDKGGLTYQPIVGAYESVGELDFSSMYPTMMANFNISPETIGCSCCPDSRIPEINYTVCRKRKGLVPLVLDHLLERRMYYKRRKKEAIGEKRALYDQRQTALKWCLVTCLDGDMMVLHRRAARWKIAPIREIVESYLPGNDWGMAAVNDLDVTGVNEALKATVKPVIQVLKAPAPPSMIRVRMRWGRQLTMIPEHECFVLEGSRLTTKRADELTAGDWIPIASTLAGLTGDSTPVDLIDVLRKALPPNEQPSWRVFGRPVRRLVREQYKALVLRGRAEYAPKTIWNWRERGYLPLDYLRTEDFTPRERRNLFIGRGKRNGGVIQRVPAVLDVDEDLGFLLGFFVGDGSSSGNMVRFAIGANERDHITRLRRILWRKFRLRGRAYRERKARMYVLQVNSVAFICILEQALGVGRSASCGKLHVPEPILNGSADAQRGFVLGLLASDGHVSRIRNFVTISSADGGFIREVSWLLTLLGVEHRLQHHGHLYHIQTKNLEETRKLFQPDAPASLKHRVRWRQREASARIFRSSQLPSAASGLLDLCRAARVARIPRVSGTAVIAKATAPVKLEQVRRRAARLAPEIAAKLPQLNILVHSDLVFARIVSVESVSHDKSYVYCFRLADEPAGFFVDGGILTHNSFGYLGYRNARFGRIEAHESVTAYSREKLLQAKEIAEARGYRMLHALVDSMWLQRTGATREDYESLAREVSDTTKLPIFVEGVYRWLTFLPSKTHRSVGVPNRYMGVFDDGSTKVRGIEVRRSDVPGIVESTQQSMLRRMFRCATLAEVRAALPEILGVLEEALVRLRAGEVIPEELVITTHLSQEVGDYRRNTVQAVTARALDRHGAHLHPGEAIQYIITDRRAHLPDDRVRPYTLLGSDWNYDAEAYADMLLRAGETVLELFGWTEGRLRKELWSKR